VEDDIAGLFEHPVDVIDRRGLKPELRRPVSHDLVDASNRARVVAVRTYEIMVETYSDFGYELVEVPRAPVEERVEFVMGEIRDSEG
jgi:hypothetical protein